MIQHDEQKVRLSALHHERVRLCQEHEQLVRTFRFLMHTRQVELDRIRETTDASFRRRISRGRQELTV